MTEREEYAPGRDHLTVSKNFQSDKYKWCPPGFVPLKLTDPAARDLLAEYARRREAIDAEFPRDLLEALDNVPVKPNPKYRPYHTVDGVKPNLEQAAWVIYIFTKHWDCSFSRKVEIMDLGGGEVLNRLHGVGGLELSNAMFTYYDKPDVDTLEGDAEIFALQAFIDGKRHRTDELTDEQARNFSIAARHLLDYLKTNYEIETDQEQTETCAHCGCTIKISRDGVVVLEGGGVLLHPDCESGYDRAKNRGDQYHKGESDG